MSTVYLRCNCPHCQRELEYPTELSAQVIDCPMCAKALTLPDPPPAQEPQAQRIFFQRFKEAGQSVLDKRKLKSLLLESVNDGILTPEELQEIRAVMEQTGIDRGILAEWSDDILNRALDSITLANLSSARIASIDHVRDFLGAHDATIPKQLERLDRWRFIASIRDGKLPSYDVQNVILKKGESAHWVQPAKLWEERVVSRRYEGGSRGVSFRIAKGVTIRTGGTRGQLVTDSADVHICDGVFVVTSQRLIFQGEAKSFETKLEKVLDMHNHLDGIRYSESNKQKPRKIQYYAPNGDIIVEILTQLFNRDAAVD